MAAVKRDPWGLAVDQALQQATPGYTVPPTMDATTMPVPVEAAAGAMRPDVGMPKEATTKVAGGNSQQAWIQPWLAKPWVGNGPEYWLDKLNTMPGGDTPENRAYLESRMRDPPGVGTNAPSPKSLWSPMGNMSLALGAPAPTTAVDALMPGTAGALLPSAGDTTSPDATTMPLPGAAAAGPPAPADATTMPVPVQGGTPMAPTAGVSDPYAAMGGGTKLPSGAWVPKPGRTATVTPGMDRAAILRLLQLGRGDRRAG